MIDIHTYARWCNHCKNHVNHDKHHETCEYAALKKEVKHLRRENFLMREVLMASYAPRVYKDES